MFFDYDINHPLVLNSHIVGLIITELVSQFSATINSELLCFFICDLYMKVSFDLLFFEIKFYTKVVRQGPFRIIFL